MGLLPPDREFTTLWRMVRKSIFFSNWDSITRTLGVCLLFRTIRKTFKTDLEVVWSLLTQSCLEQMIDFIQGSYEGLDNFTVTDGCLQNARRTDCIIFFQPTNDTVYMFLCRNKKTLSQNRSTKIAIFVDLWIAVCDCYTCSDFWPTLVRQSSRAPELSKSFPWLANSESKLLSHTADI